MEEQNNFRFSSNKNRVFLSDSETALRCAQFFLALSQNCFELSKTMNKDPPMNIRAEKGEEAAEKDRKDLMKTKKIIKERTKEYGIKPKKNISLKTHSNESQSTKSELVEDNFNIKQKLAKLITEKSDLRRQKEHNEKHKQTHKSKKQQKEEKKLKLKTASIKKPTSAYIFYYQAQHKIFAEKFPGMKNNELTKLIAESWNKLKDQEKKPYLKQALQSREIYQDKKIELFGNNSENKQKDNQAVLEYLRKQQKLLFGNRNSGKKINEQAQELEEEENQKQDDEDDKNQSAPELQSVEEEENENEEDSQFQDQKVLKSQMKSHIN